MFKIGDLVVHSKYGNGTVVEVFANMKVGETVSNGIRVSFNENESEYSSRKFTETTDQKLEEVFKAIGV